MMAQTGLLVVSFPIVLGCDAAGTVVEIGSGVKKFKQGDQVCGCTRLGSPGYCTFQEFFLMDEDLIIKTPENISLLESSTVGVGSYTAALGIYDGMKIGASHQENKDEWVVVLGASGNVGQYAVQVCQAALHESEMVDKRNYANLGRTYS